MIKPKKSLGQNFLIDNNIINKMLKHVDIRNNNIVEIGPGTGNLTTQIIQQDPKSLILIEKDRSLSDSLKKKFKDNKKIYIFNNDIMQFDLENELKKDTIVIGNLPYNISSQILAKLIKFKKWLPKYKKLILMFQKEVADKILAKHKSSDFGRLAVLTNARLKITNSFNISQNCFYPVPKVKSTVLVFEPIINNNFSVNDISNLEKITHIFFSKKRKMVNKAFNSLFKNPSQIAKKIKIDLTLRPNQLTEHEYYKITEYFEKKS